jgi:vacuolar-type H+-ATPase subunit H
MSVRSSDTASPLLVIREREHVLASEIDAAHERANSRIAQARIQAAEIKDTAEREGVAEARAMYDRAVSNASEQADSIRSAGAEEAAALLRVARPRIPAAVEEIMRFVLPAQTAVER